jgi:hypothetical protein
LQIFEHQIELDKYARHPSDKLASELP